MMAEAELGLPSGPRSEESSFLNHSVATVYDGLSASTSEKPLSRQKRKRTSPEDQATLEAAYKHDPKPDKAARQELVKQVALGEKEVQIWFQNRRQSSRRKARPLLPHEVAQYQMSRTGSSTALLGSSVSSNGSEQCVADHVAIDKRSQSRELSIEDDEDQHAAPANPERPSTLHATYPDCEKPLELSQHVPRYSASRPIVPAGDREVTANEEQHRLGYLSNRRSAPHIPRNSLSLTSESMLIREPRQHGLKKSSSCVRLSLNAEGKAEIVTKDAASPSPPRPQQSTLLLGSAKGLPIATTQSFSTASSLQRSCSGRSRDSRSWTFWCDKEARNELEHAAEKDASGSAAGAIGLLRTASGRNVLGSLPSKRNSGFGLQTSSSKRKKLDHKRPPLQRARTSLGRLQSKAEHLSSTAPKLGRSHTSKGNHAKGSDSDKENWSPEAEGSYESGYLAASNVNRRQQSFDGRGPANLRSARNADRQSEGGANEGNNDPENDPELADFMRAGSKKPHGSEEDDLDCVQGLLSLSQGNWR